MPFEINALRRLIARVALPRSRFVWMALQIPVFAALIFIYNHRPLADPTAVNYDVRLYFDAASSVLNGQLPYRDFFFQYPPLALAFFVPPRWFAPDLASYFVWFDVELFILACVGVIVTAALAERVGQPVGLSLLFYSLALLAIGAIIPQRYDLAPAIVVVLALAAWLGEKHGTAFALLAIGTLVKIYPALLLPLFIIAGWRSQGRRTVVRGLLIFAGVILLFMLPFLLLSPQETMGAFGGQATRGVGIASVYATLLLAGRSIGVPAQIIYQPGLNSWNVELPNADWLPLAATGLQLCMLGLMYLRYLRSPGDSGPVLVRYSAAVIGVGLLTSKVLSAQYVIWLFPLALLGGERRLVWSAALFLISALLTQLLFPFLWTELKQGTDGALLVALARDVCLAVLCLQLVQAPSIFVKEDIPELPRGQANG